MGGVVKTREKDRSGGAESWVMGMVDRLEKGVD
jgi:hypothetical protein